MLIRKLVCLRKKILFASATALLAGAFQSGGCTINVDENLLQSLSNLVESYGGPALGSGGGPHVREGPHFGPGSPSDGSGDQEDTNAGMNEQQPT